MLTISRFAAPVAIVASLLVAGPAPHAECTRDIELASAILGGSFMGRWAQNDSSTTWVAILHIEGDEWRPDSVFTAKGLGSEAGLERHFFRAQPLAVLSGNLPLEPLWMTNGILRNIAQGTTLQIGEYFEPAIGDTIVQVETRPLAGTMPGTAYVGLCSTVPVEHGYAMGVPLATIVERPGVAKRNPLPSIPDLRTK